MFSVTVLDSVACAEVRDWKGLMPHIATLSNAYRPRSNADNRIPHSFVFRRRDSHLPAGSSGRMADFLNYYTLGTPFFLSVYWPRLASQSTSDRATTSAIRA